MADTHCRQNAKQNGIRISMACVENKMRSIRMFACGSVGSSVAPFDSLEMTLTLMLCTLYTY